MRQIQSKYDGECTACGESFEAGTTIGYSKPTGTFCVGCIPTDPEEIRAYRQAKIDRKNDRRESWAQARERRAAAAQRTSDTLMGRDRSSDGRADWALVTQPGYIPQRARANRAQEKAWGELAKADEHRSKKLGRARVAGDAERAREAKREKAREWVEKGMLVRSVLYGLVRVTRVNKKTVSFVRESDGAKGTEPLDWISKA